MANDELLTDTRLRSVLGARPFKFELQTDSSNDIAREWALQGAITGSVVITEEQVRGRGRFGRTWLAHAGSSLLLSVILRPRLSQARLPLVTIVGAVAAAETLSEYAPNQVKLKWPNDVHLAGRKVGGILSEATWHGDTLSAVVLGIGLNVRMDFANTPLTDKAISLEMVTGQPVDRAALLAKLLRAVDYWAMRVEDPELVERWRGWLDTLGKHVTALSSAGTISGQASAVDGDGALLLRTDDGTIHRIVAGEVSLTE